MNKTGRRQNYLLLSTIARAAPASIAAAQTAPPAGPSEPNWGHHGNHGPGPKDWQAETAKMEERRLAELHTKLNLKPGQEPAWHAFVTGLQAARPAPKPHDRLDWDEMTMRTAPERLDHMLARVDEMRAHLAQMDQVVKTFYGVLSKDQQTIFDDNFKHMGPPRGGREDHDRMEGDPMEGGRMGRLPMGHPGGPGRPDDIGGPPPPT
jgi:protein CpxP